MVFMSKSINIFGFHSIESILINTNPESSLKSTISKMARKDKRVIDLINDILI